VKLQSVRHGLCHTIYVGAVLRAKTTGERPLIFFRGKYHRLPD
jgi:hypothetical protein